MSPYRFHLAKLRWFCEQGAQGAIIGLEWAGHSYISDFLMDFPVDSLCRVKGTRNVSPDEAGYTPFRRQPSLGSQLEIRRDAHAVFNAWHKAAYIVRNPRMFEGVNPHPPRIFRGIFRGITIRSLCCRLVVIGLLDVFRFRLGSCSARIRVRMHH